MKLLKRASPAQVEHQKAMDPLRRAAIEHGDLVVVHVGNAYGVACPEGAAGKPCWWFGNHNPSCDLPDLLPTL